MPSGIGLKFLQIFNDFLGTDEKLLVGGFFVFLHGLRLSYKKRYFIYKRRILFNALIINLIEDEVNSVNLFIKIH